MVEYTKDVRNNIKKLPLLSILFIILSIEISSIYPQTMAQESTYENIADGIRIKFPADWNVCEDNQTLTPQHGFVCPPAITLSSLIVTFHPPPMDPTEILSKLIEHLRTQDQSTLERYLERILGSSASLSVWVFPSSNQPLSNHVNEKIKELQETASAFNIVTSEYVTIGASIPAYELSYTLELWSGEEKNVMTIWTIHDSKAYQFTYLSDPIIYPTYLRTILGIINSLEFI